MSLTFWCKYFNDDPYDWKLDTCAFWCVYVIFFLYRQCLDSDCAIFTGSNSFCCYVQGFWYHSYEHYSNYTTSCLVNNNMTSYKRCCVSCSLLDSLNLWVVTAEKINESSQQQWLALLSVSAAVAAADNLTLLPVNYITGHSDKLSFKARKAALFYDTHHHFLKHDSNLPQINFKSSP